MHLLHLCHAPPPLIQHKIFSVYSMFINIYKFLIFSLYIVRIAKYSGVFRGGASPPLEAQPGYLPPSLPQFYAYDQVYTLHEQPRGNKVSHLVGMVEGIGLIRKKKIYIYILGAIKNDLRTVWSPYKMIAYIMMIYKPSKLIYSCVHIDRVYNFLRDHFTRIPLYT